MADDRLLNASIAGVPESVRRSVPELAADGAVLARADLRSRIDTQCAGGLVEGPRRGGRRRAAEREGEDHGDREGDDESGA